MWVGGSVCRSFSNLLCDFSQRLLPSLSEETVTYVDVEGQMKEIVATADS